MPLLEMLLTRVQPQSARSVLAHMRKGISDEELLRRPDLASAVDGWELACEGVEAQAVSAWRAARRTSCFFRALCRSPPPNALLMATCAPNLEVPSTRHVTRHVESSPLPSSHTQCSESLNPRPRLAA